MQDRISNHPNRWVLTPVTGETNTYDFTRADDPTQAGTPLNKATFLPDAVASALEQATGTSGIDLPADALNAIASVLSGLDVSIIGHVETGSYVGTGQGGSSYPCTLNLNFKPKLVIITKDYFHVYAKEGAMWVNGLTKLDANNTASVNNTTFTWYTTALTDRAAYQLNSSGTTYYYLAIGVE